VKKKSQFPPAFIMASNSFSSCTRLVFARRSARSGMGAYLQVSIHFSVGV
jgi:hypothetical protein